MDPSNTPLLPPPPGATSNFINPPSLALTSLRVGIVFLVFSSSFFIARIYSKARISHSSGLDDLSCFIAMILSVGVVVLNIEEAPLLTYYYDVPVSTYTQRVAIATSMHDLLASLVMFFAKTSVFLLYKTIFNISRCMTILIYLGITISFFIYWAIIPLDLYFCFPRPGESWIDIPLAMSCGHEETYSILLGSWNVCVDLYLLILPIPMIWNLNMATSRKLGVLSIFMLGLLALVVSIINLWARVKLMVSVDGGWYDGITSIMITVESNTAIVCSCMPAVAHITKHHYAYTKISALGKRILSWKSNARSSKETELSDVLPRKAKKVSNDDMQRIILPSWEDEERRL